MMISASEANAIHDRQVELSGGMAGIRDEGILDAVLHSPWQTFGGADLYPTDAEKAARLAFELITQHPYADGNKRTATVLMISYLRRCGYRFKPRHDELYDAVIGVADGSLGYEDMLAFVRRTIESEKQGA